MPGAPRRRADYRQEGGSLRRALRLLRAVSLHHPERVSLRSLSEETGISKATAFRLLSVLVEEGMLQFHPDTKTYGLGAQMAAMGARQLGRHAVRLAARPVMERLWRETEETVTLSLRLDGERVYVDQIPSPQPVRFEVELGSRYPLHAGATGRAILAWLPPHEREAYLSGPLRSFTPRTLTDPDALRDALAECRRQGFALSHGERAEGAISVAVPVLDAQGVPVAAVSVCAPDNRATPASMAAFGPRLAAAGREISTQLGWMPEPAEPKGNREFFT